MFGHSGIVIATRIYKQKNIQVTWPREVVIIRPGLCRKEMKKVSEIERKVECEAKNSQSLQ